MPSFSMDELKKSLGLNATVVTTSHTEIPREGFSRVGERRGRSIDETKALIKSAIHDAGRAMTMGEICIVLERKQTPHIRKILHDMGDAGELIEVADLAPNKMMTRFWYSLP